MGTEIAGFMASNLGNLCLGLIGGKLTRSEIVSVMEMGGLETFNSIICHEYIQFKEIQDTTR